MAPQGTTPTHAWNNSPFSVACWLARAPHASSSSPSFATCRSLPYVHARMRVGQAGTHQLHSLALQELLAGFTKPRNVGAKRTEVATRA